MRKARIFEFCRFSSEIFCLFVCAISGLINLLLEKRINPPQSSGKIKKKTVRKQIIFYLGCCNFVKNIDLISMLNEIFQKIYLFIF